MSPDPKSVRTALFLSFALTLLGSCGVSNGTELARMDDLRAAAPMLGVTEKAREAERHLIEVRSELFLEMPHRKALGVVDVIVSCMLIAGSFMLGARRRSTEWWLVNSVVANVLVIWAILGVGLSHAFARWNRITHALTEYVRAMLEADGQSTAGVEAAAQLNAVLFVGFAVAVATAWTGLHLYVLYRATREDVRGFVASAKDER